MQTPSSAFPKHSYHAGCKPKEFQMLTDENFPTHAFTWRTRQAGISVVFDGENEQYSYNAYCIETKQLKELFTCEYDFLEDALVVINQEYGNWELSELSPEKTGCGSCAAK